MALSWFSSACILKNDTEGNPTERQHANGNSDNRDARDILLRDLIKRRQIGRSGGLS